MKKLWCLLACCACVTLASAQSRLTYKFPDVVPEPHPLRLLGPGDEIFTFLKTGNTTCGSYTLAEGIVPAGSGPLPHIHHWDDEWFYFPDGGMVVYMSETAFPDLGKVPGHELPKAAIHRYHTKPGDLIYGPRYYIHGFQNETQHRVRLLTIWTLGNITDFFRQLGPVVADPEHPPAADPTAKQRILTLAPKFGMNQSGSWEEYVSAVDDHMKPGDNQARRLDALLAPDVAGAKRGPCK